MALGVPKYFGTLDYDIHHIVVDNEVWFCGKDVGEHLGYKNNQSDSRWYQRKIQKTTV